MLRDIEELLHDGDVEELPLEGLEEEAHNEQHHRHQAARLRQHVRQRLHAPLEVQYLLVDLVLYEEKWLL